MRLSAAFTTGCFARSSQAKPSRSASRSDRIHGSSQIATASNAARIVIRQNGTNTFGA